MSEELHNAPIAFVDENHSQLSRRIINAFYGPHFKTPEIISHDEIDKGLDTGQFTFVVEIPPHFERNMLAQRETTIQIHIDATRMNAAFIGSGYIQNIIAGEISEFSKGYRAPTHSAIKLTKRYRFNPSLNGVWFGGVVELIGHITMLSVILSGAAIVREREHGTLEHLLGMPLTSFQIISAKIWSMALIVLCATGLSLYLVIYGLLEMPSTGSNLLFLFGTAVYLFATTSLGILLGTLAKTMPQLGLLVLLFILPLEMLSGGSTPFESMPIAVQHLMSLTPTPHFVRFSQGILYRGAGLDVLWSSCVAMACIGSALFFISLRLFRRSVTLRHA